LIQVKFIVNKSRSVRRVKPEPDQLDSWTGLSKSKDRNEKKPGKTQLTRDPAKLG